MKNARYAAEEESLKSGQIELRRQLNEYLNFCHRSSGDISNFMPRFGFRLAIRQSHIAGLGVFLIEGSVEKGQLVALYPGTVYRAWDPKFLQSINNDVFLQCIDKVYIDAKCTGLSSFVYKSCEARERSFDTRQSADRSWIEAARLGNDGLLANMLNCGQLINNRTNDLESNVAYVEIDVPFTELDRRLMKYIPNVVYSAHGEEESLRLCGLIALRDLDSPIELLSDYHTVVVV